MVSAPSSRSWNSEQNSRSSVSNFAVVARIICERGLRGEVKALPLTDMFQVLKTSTTVFLTAGDVQQPYLIRSIRMQNRFALISFEGINSREAASVWRGALMSVDRGLLPLNEGEYYHDQILGLTVETTAGLPLGEVTDIIETGSNDVYVVRSDRREYLIPAIRDVIREIDLDRQKIVVRVVDGLLD